MKNIIDTSDIYPQFNNCRDLDDYKDYYDFAKNLINDGAIYNTEPERHFSDDLKDKYDGFKEEAEKLVAEGDAMTSETIIDPKKDAETIEKFRVFREKVRDELGGRRTAKEWFDDRKNEFSDFISDVFSPALKSLEDFIYSKTGPKGFFD